MAFTPPAASLPRFRTRTAFDQRIPLRDGVTLSADITFPIADDDAARRWPSLLTRTPYVKATETMVQRARWWAERGYVFVAVDVRGRGDSDGEFIPYFSEGRDGFDSIEWIAGQPWSDGAVGTLGGSYLGRIQWLAALEQPPHLRAMAVAVPPSDPFVETPTGLPSPMHLCWLHYTSGRQTQPMSAVDWEQVYTHLPLLTMDEAAGRGEMRKWREEIAHARLDDYWRRICYQDQFARLSVPTLHISGWYDDEQIGTPLNFAGMTTSAATEAARRSQRLLMGPWGHAVNTTSKLGEVDFGSAALIDLDGEQLAWFDRWLRGVGADEPLVPARIFIMGENVWRDEQEWPLARTQWTRYHLRGGSLANSRFGDGALSTEAPPADEASDRYRYDPARPTPFLTEATSSQIGGPDDYAAVQRRDDVLVYQSEPLAQPLEVTGPIQVELYASSSAPDTDFMAMLLDVWPSGFAQRLTDGMVRVRFRDGMAHPTLAEPGETLRLTVDCWTTAHVFQPGHRIAVQIASAAFPKYDRNLNTGAPLGTTSEMCVAEQTIYHDAARPSAILLPVIPRPY